MLFTPILKTNEDIHAHLSKFLKKQKAADAGATQILIQGGLNPDLKLDYYEKCLSLIRDNVDIWIHSLSPTEIEYIAAEENITIKECLIRLQAAGLQSLPGGGAEMLVDDIRKRSVQKHVHKHG